MLVITAPAGPDIRQGRARALCVAGGALSAALAWTVEVPLLGIDLNFRYGTSHTKIVAAAQVTGASLATVLLGWLLLAVLERHTAHARPRWTALALAGLAASVSLPLSVASTAATAPAAVAALAVMHLTIGAAVIPAMARTSRPHRRHDQEASRLTLNARTTVRADNPDLRDRNLELVSSRSSWAHPTRSNGLHLASSALIWPHPAGARTSCT
jgi:hypothetical protein